jgi:GTP cyclohydrolase IB
MDSLMYHNSYIEPDREYDADLSVNADYIDTLPDLQNGPESLIKGAHVAIPRVGIHNFRVPIEYLQRDSDTPIKLETSITGTVSLEAEKKGINMSRIMRTFYEHKDSTMSLDYLEHVLVDYRKKLGSFDSSIIAKFSYPIMRPSLRSGLSGWQYYDVAFHLSLDKNSTLKKYIEFDFVYSSTCPCSYELSEHARKYRNKAAVPHSQRSVARILVEIDPTKPLLYIEDLRDICDDAMQTETQVMVKREDEQAFAELNGANTKFVEDAARLFHERLSADGRIVDFRVVLSHLESLHSHDAIAIVTKGVEGGLRPEMSHYEFRSLVK